MQGRACFHCADPGRVGCAATAAAPTLPHLTVVLRWLLPCVVSHARLDGPVLPGRKVACCGHKMGLLGTWLRGMLALPPGHNTLTVIVAVCTGVNNGRFWFDHVRIPRVNLLNKYASVTPEGEYTSMIPSDDLRFAVSMGELVAGRVNMTGGANNISKVRTRTPAHTLVVVLATSPCDSSCTRCPSSRRANGCVCGVLDQLALATAVRYAHVRRQFGDPGQPERRLIDYPIHQVGTRRGGQPVLLGTMRR